VNSADTQKTAHNNNDNTMLCSTRTRLPADVFSIGDRVKCVNTRSKHYAHTALVVGMGKTRLNVEFENGHNGKFIDWRDAELIIPPVEPVTTNGVNPSSSNIEGNSDIDQLTSLLDHLAFTTATLISSNHEDPRQMTRLLDLFDRSVREHTNLIAGTRNHTNQRTSGDRIPP
jgi:hypothetical protein